MPCMTPFLVSMPSTRHFSSVRVIACRHCSAGGEGLAAEAGRSPHPGKCAPRHFRPLDVRPSGNACTNRGRYRPAALQLSLAVGSLRWPHSPPASGTVADLTEVLRSRCQRERLYTPRALPPTAGKRTPDAIRITCTNSRQCALHCSRYIDTVTYRSDPTISCIYIFVHLGSSTCLARNNDVAEHESTNQRIAQSC